MSGIIKTSKLNCTENAGSTFSLAGVPLTTATLFTKTFTVSNGYVFSKAPSINLNNVTDKNSYTVTINDTGSIAGGNLTVRSFVVKYKYPLKQVASDTISFVARAELDIANSVGKIYDYILNTKWVPAEGEVKLLSVFGDEGDANNAAASFTLDFKKGNSSIRISPSGVAGSGTVNIPTGGRYDENLIFPQVTANATYSVVLTQIANNSFLTLPTPKTITIQQYIDPIITISCTQSASKFITTAASLTHTDDPFSTRGKELGIEWYVTSQSSTVPMKYVGTFAHNDFSGTALNDGKNYLVNGTEITYNDLSVEIYSQTTATTSGSTATTAVTLAASNSGIVKGMRVTGSGITASGASSCIVTAVSGTSVTLSVAPGGTIANGTTLTFHAAAHIMGSVFFNKLGTTNATSSIVVDNILDFNAAPVPTFTGTTNITAEEAGNFTTMTLAATDAESDTLTFKVTVMPQHGTFKYTDAQGSLQTVTCTGQTLTSNNTIHATTRNVQYKPADGNSNNTSFAYTVADPYNSTVTTTITLNISAG